MDALTAKIQTLSGQYCLVDFRKMRFRKNNESKISGWQLEDAR